MVSSQRASVRSVSQQSLERLSTYPWLVSLIDNPTISREFVSRYVAGDDLESVVDVTRTLADQHRLVSLSAFSPVPQDKIGAESNVEYAMATMRRMHASGLVADDRCEISVAWEAIGGVIDEHGVIARLRRLADAATTYGVLLTVETEGEIIDRTINAVMNVRMDYPDVGVSVPAALRRSLNVCKELAYAGSRVRLRKGSPGDGIHAYVTPFEVDLAYVRCMKALMMSSAYPMLATHDVRILQIVKALAGHVRRDPDSYECVLRMGIRPDQQAIIADRGDRVRTYVPYGAGWLPYVVRRMSTQPRAWSMAAKAALGR